MKPKDQDSKSGVIYSYQCHHLDCDEEYIGETSRTLGKRRKEHLKQPSPIHGHSQTTGHSIENNSFNIIGREDWEQPGPSRNPYIYKGKQSHLKSKHW